MRKSKFKFIQLLAVLSILFMFNQSISAEPDVLVDLRLYKGAREKESVQPNVVTSYYLRPLATAGKILDVDLSDEKEELKKIFNLKGIELITQAKWAWKKGVTQKQFELIVLNGRKFIVQLILLNKKDHFKLKVLEEGKEKEKEALQSMLIIPQGKTSVFGFEDSFGKPYFLSCQRHQDKEVHTGEPIKVRSLKKPRLIKKVKPEYPQAAVKAGIEGKVIAEVVTDVYGRVADVTKVEGHPLLNDASVEALKKWIYEPFILDGKPVRVKFTVVVSFNLNKKGEEGEAAAEQPAKASALKRKPKLIKKVTPAYPEQAKKEKISGKVIIEAVTDLEGNVKKITKVVGPPILTKAAIEAVKQWKYEPYIIDGKPKAVKFTTIVNFNLDKKKKELKE